MSLISKLALCGATLCSASVFAATAEPDTHPAVDLSGHVAIASKYVSRGLSNAAEDDNVAIQLGLNASYGNAYVSYWGSTLGYSFAELEGKAKHRADQIEHDLTVGYTQSLGNLDWDLWNTTYYYTNSSHTTGNELGLTVSRELTERTSAAFSVSTYLNDVVYANQGDTFYLLNVSHQLDDRWTLMGNLAGGYFHGHGRFEGKDLGDTIRNHAFRYASAGVSYAILPQLTLSGEYILGGDDRYDEKQRDVGVFSLQYDF